MTEAAAPLHLRAVELRLWAAEVLADEAPMANPFRILLPTNLSCSLRAGDTELVHLHETRVDLGGSISSRPVVTTVPITISALRRLGALRSEQHAPS